MAAPPPSAEVISRAAQIHVQFARQAYFMQFNDPEQEWRNYQSWRASQTAKPEGVSWPRLYLEERIVDVGKYIQQMRQAATRERAGDVALANYLDRLVRNAEALRTVYEQGVDDTIIDPRDQAAWANATDNMVVSLNAQASAAEFPRNIANQTPTGAQAPPGQAPPAPDPVFVYQTPSSESFLDSLFHRKFDFIGAANQTNVAKARGFREKRFAPLFRAIPQLVPGQQTTSTSTTDNNGLGGTAATGGATDAPPPPPYNIQQELNADPRPARIDFQCFGFQRHPEDYNDEYFITNYRMLYDRTTDFAEKWFGDIDLPDPGYTGSPWQEDFNEQFIEYTRLVAHEDRLAGGWEALLRQAKYRKWLTAGIIGQVIQKKVFSELLFGAPENWKHELEREDVVLVDIEGYRRKARRSETAKIALQGAFVPRDFWGEVDELAWRTALIFEPLINLLDLYRPITPQDQTNERHFYQELHMILSIAAYLQVCMAISSSVFHNLSATPGARMDYPIEQQAEVALYRESKEINETFEAQWEEAQDRLGANQTVTQADLDRFNAYYPLPLPPPATAATAAATAAAAAARAAIARAAAAAAAAAAPPGTAAAAPAAAPGFPANANANNHNDQDNQIPKTPQEQYDLEKRTARHHRLRGARIKIAVFPMLKRYTPQNRGVRLRANEAVSDTNWQTVEGQRISDIFRCTVIYYQGLMYPRNPHDDGVQLDAHLTLIKGWERRPARLTWTACVFLGFALGLVGVFVVWLRKLVLYDFHEANDFVFSTFTRAFYIWFDSPRASAVQMYEANDRNFPIMFSRMLCNIFCLGNLCLCPGTTA